MVPHPFYVTTAIDYPNGKPHIGHAYEKLIADTFARFHRVVGDDVFFLTGCDEHGQKLQKAAKEKSMTPQQFVDMMVETYFIPFTKQLNLSHDFFVRTTQQSHMDLCVDIFKKVHDNGDIYKGDYEGYYCTPCESFWTELQLDVGLCPECKREVELIKEESYFFRMSKYQEMLLDHFKQHPEFVQPEFRRNEIMYRLKNEELKDLSISRNTFDWGIPLPTDKSHVIYVWFDALINYLSGIGYTLENKSKYWPCDMHVIGKDILWFHAVIWPTILLSAGIALPKTIFVHGFVNDKDGQKMSKSKGNVIDPVEVLTEFSSDALRYYLLRSVATGQDANFSRDDLIKRYNNELANDLGNLVQRVIVMSKKYYDLVLVRPDGFDEHDHKIIHDVYDAIKSSEEHVNTLDLHKALDSVWKAVHLVNKYLNEKQPWHLAKDSPEELHEVMYVLCECTRMLTIALSPYLPDATQKMMQSLGLDDVHMSLVRLLDCKAKYELCEVGILFEKIEVKKEEKVQEPAKVKNVSDENVFALQMKVGKVTDVANHPDADKLYVLQIDCGDEKRQLVAGLKAYLSPEELMSKNVLVLANLKPAKLRGQKSEGMVLAAETPDESVVVTLSCDAPLGSIVQVEGMTVNESKIEYKDFEKVSFEVKDKCVYVNGVKLVADGCDVVADISDGAQVR